MTENEPSSDGDGDGEDRISWLPDEILHEILDRLCYHYQCAETALMSKRWNHLWLSYPVLEFDCQDYIDNAPPRSEIDCFIAVVRRKFSSSGLNSYIRSVNIVSFDSAFIEATLDLIQNREPEEIDMTTSRDWVIPTHLLNSSKIRTLKLERCKLLEQDQYKKMVNLRELNLSSVAIDNRALNSMIAAAPLLEKLTLKDIDYIKRLEICNHTNLKHLQLSELWTIQIVLGALHSLESMSLYMLGYSDPEIICSSLLPCLKLLDIEKCYDMKGHVVSNLISRCPSLLFLRLVTLTDAKELKIESPTLEKLVLEWHGYPKSVMLHIDAPRLVNVHLSGDMHCMNAISLQVAETRSCTLELSLKNCNRGGIENLSFKNLKELLGKVTLQFQFVELQFHYFKKNLIVCDQVEDESPTPIVERVEVLMPFKRRKIDQTFLYNMLWSCHPKYASVHRDGYMEKSYRKLLSSLELINKVFFGLTKKERNSPNCNDIICKCWRHRLKDLKIVICIHK
ncbi:F-box/FBD/LRR-repeat protein At5g53840 [Linum perenne]